MQEQAPWERKFKVSCEVLQDYLAVKCSKKDWKAKVSESIKSEDTKLVFDHPIVKRAKHFSTSPVGIAFFVANDELHRIAYATMFSRLTPELEDSFDPDRCILYYICTKPDGEIYIRFARFDVSLNLYDDNFGPIDRR